MAISTQREVPAYLIVSINRLSFVNWLYRIAFAGSFEAPSFMYDRHQPYPPVVLRTSLPDMSKPIKVRSCSKALFDFLISSVPFPDLSI